MQLPGLRRAVSLQTEPTPRLIDEVSGEVLAISRTEAQLLQRWDGVSGATPLSARVFLDELDVDPWQVEQFFARLDRLQLLGKSPPIVPDFVSPKPGVEKPSDRVPALRPDLVIAKLVPSGEVLEVFDPKRGRGFSLLDFEISLARMLDGKRTAAEVLERAASLGIAVSLQTFRGFLQQLNAYQFIDHRVKEGTTTWPKRTAWTPEVRELYQRALKALRAGDPHEARVELNALKRLDPGNLEAGALRLRLETRTLKVDHDVLHAPATPTAVIRTGEIAALTPSDERAPPLKIDPFASFGFEGDPPTKSGLPPIPETLTSAKRKRTVRKWLMVAAGVGVLLLLLRPVPVLRSVPCELQVDKRGVPRASLAGLVTPAGAKLGTTVTKGTVLARIESIDGEAALDKQLAALEKQVQSLAPDRNTARITKARAALKTAEAAVAAVEKQKKKATRKTLPALEKTLATRVKGRDAAKAALEALTHDLARAPLAAELKKLKAQRASGEFETPKAELIAPADGVFVSVGPLPVRIFETDAYGQIVAPQFKLLTKQKLEAKVDEAVFRYEGGEVDVKFEAGVPKLDVTQPLVGLKGTLELPEGHEPWLFSF